MTRTRAVLLGMLVHIAMGYGMQLRAANAAEGTAVRPPPPPMRHSQVPLSPEVVQQMARAQRGHEVRRIMGSNEPDDMWFQLPPNYRLPSSTEWQTREKSAYRRLLATGRFDALVLPFQVLTGGFDRPTRSLMTDILSQAVGRATRWRLPDPQAVAKALGEGVRKLDPKEVFDLADALGVQHIVVGYAGHNKQGFMHMEIRRMDRSTEKPVPGRPTDWIPVGDAAGGQMSGIPLPQGAVPIEQFTSRMPDIMQALGLAFDGIGGVKSARLNFKGLGETPASLLSMQDNPANEAYAFLLYAALVPRLMERQKEKFAEQAYLALGRLAHTSPEYRVLRARTLLTLGSREAALQLLAAPASHEERGLLAFANGNLPELQDAAAKEKHPIKRLLLKIDENQLAMSYGLRNQKQAWAEVERMRLPGNYWPHLVGRAFVEHEGWAQFDNALPKHLMDVSYPIKGFVLEKMVKGLLLLNDRAKLQALVDRSFIDHARKLHEADPARWCCRVAPGRLGPPDYLALLLSIGHDNLLRRIDFYATIQGDGAGALAYANSVESIYKGLPYFELLKSKAELAYAKEANASEQDGLRKSAYERALNAMYWEQGQSRISNSAADHLSEIGRRDYGQGGNLYQFDRPYRPYYWTWARGIRQTEIEHLRAAMSNATSEFQVVWKLYGFYKDDASDEQIAALLKSIEGRFNGAPQKNELLADMALTQGDRQTAKAYYRLNAQQLPEHWPSVFRWGWLQYQDGEVREAAQAWAGYAGFREGSGENRVGIANVAYEVGSWLYWAGHLDLAEPFYRLSAAQKVGAASDISSATRLGLVAGDLDGAFAGLQRRAHKYQDSYAYRDYLGLLHAAGRSEEAWEVFASLVRDQPGRPHVWETAMTGHRRAKASEDALLAWVRQPGHLRAGPARNAGAVYLLRVATTDRIPSATVADAIQHLDPPIWQLDSLDNRVVRPSDDGKDALILGPDSNEGRSMLRPGLFASAKKHRVRSNLALFAAGYRELKLKHWQAAKAIFDEAAALYDMNANSGFMLPYYAYAQARAGGQQAAEQLLARIKSKQQGFDYFLARAALESAKGHREEAFKLVTRARYARPHTEGRPLLTQYTFGDFVELLFEQSGDPRLRDLALSWAQVFQKIEPWQSWSYAIEARLGKTEADRGKAMAMTHYLDPESERLSRVKRQDVERAVKVWGTAQPFVLERSQPSGRPEKI